MEIHWVDVFATGPLTGNPLAVVMGDPHPPPGRMQAMAAELGLSETVFAARGPIPSLRIFTPAAEIPLAGHPLVGAAWVLRRAGWIGDDGEVQTAGGRISVRADAGSGWMTHDQPVMRGIADPVALGSCLGTAVTGGSPIWDAGLPQVMVPVADLDVLRPDHEGLRALGIRGGWAGVSAYVVRQAGGDEAQAEVRHFAAPIGISEDPVTGSAAGALGAALAAQRGGPVRLTVRQGHHMGRPGEVIVRAGFAGHAPAAVTVGGSVVPVMSGTVGRDVLAG